MATEDNHNHFCIYCGTKLHPGQNFCSECGKPIFQDEIVVKNIHSKYDAKIDQLEQEYNIKQQKAKELVDKLFDPSNMAYERFNSAIIKSNNLFNTQVGIARKMAEIDVNENPIVAKEMQSKINTLEKFIEKMEDLINELIIHLSSNKKDNDDVDSLFNDMDELIDSVKNY